MNIDATETDLRAVSEVLKLAAILDDRAPAADKTRIAAWAEKVHKHRLQRDDLLDGLQAFYDEPRDRAIGIGDLLAHARRIKRDRLDREADAERDRRRAELDPKAVDEMQMFAAGVVTGPSSVMTDRMVAAERGLQCAVDKRSAQESIREYFAAKREAKGLPAAYSKAAGDD
jgi:hypothetical protein